jgi:hypothetical protein
MIFEEVDHVGAYKVSAEASPAPRFSITAAARKAPASSQEGYRRPRLTVRLTRDPFGSDRPARGFCFIT